MVLRAFTTPRGAPCGAGAGNEEPRAENGLQQIAKFHNSDLGIVRAGVLTETFLTAAGWPESRRCRRI